jgi:hypothetical protein
MTINMTIDYLVNFLARRFHFMAPFTPFCCFSNANTQDKNNNKAIYNDYRSSTCRASQDGLARLPALFPGKSHIQHGPSRSHSAGQLNTCNQHILLASGNMHSMDRLCGRPGNLSVCTVALLN